MADHVVVMRDGVIEQQGSPLSLYDTPASRFVAGFIGSPAMNFVPGSVDADGSSVTLDLPGANRLPLSRRRDPGRKVVVGLRPEHLQVVDVAAAQLVLPVTVVESTGSLTYVTTAGSPELTVVITGRSAVHAGSNIGLAIAPEHVHVFDAETEKAI